MKHKNVRIVIENTKPYGIRDETGYLFFFPGIPMYPDQDERYKREISEQYDLAEYLGKCLKERVYGNET